MSHKIKPILFLFFILAVSAFSCRNHEKTVENQDLAVKSVLDNDRGNVRLIFYNMYLPPQASRIFERAGANYNPSILNQPENFPRYQNAHKLALNLGIYGVDLSYTRMFDQATLTAKYFSTIRMMANNLGIPQDYYDNILTRIDRNSRDKDSLVRLAEEIYELTDDYLKDNNLDANASLIVTGGWIEALYISTRILDADPDNVEMSDRIAEQKYSLNSLISLLSNYQEDIAVAGDLLMLKLLKKSFDRYDIFYDADDFALDTVNGLISASAYNSGMTQDIMDEISEIVGQIRIQLIN